MTLTYTNDEKFKFIFALPNVHDLDENALVASVIDYR